LQTASVVAIIGCYSHRLLHSLTVYSGFKMLAGVAIASQNLYNARKVETQNAPNEARAKYKVFPLQ